MTERYINIFKNNQITNKNDIIKDGFKKILLNNKDRDELFNTLDDKNCKNIEIIENNDVIDKQANNKYYLFILAKTDKLDIFETVYDNNYDNINVLIENISYIIQSEYMIVTEYDGKKKIYDATNVAKYRIKRYKTLFCYKINDNEYMYIYIYIDLNTTEKLRNIRSTNFSYKDINIFDRETICKILLIIKDYITKNFYNYYKNLFLKKFTDIYNAKKYIEKINEYEMIEDNNSFEYIKERETAFNKYITLFDDIINPNYIYIYSNILKYFKDEFIKYINDNTINLENREITSNLLTNIDKLLDKIVPDTKIKLENILDRYKKIKKLKQLQGGRLNKQHQLYMNDKNKYFIIYNKKNIYLNKKNTYKKGKCLYVKINKNLDIKIKH